MIDLDLQIKQNTLSHAYIFESSNENYNLEFANNFSKKVFESKGIYIENNLNPDLYIIDNGNDTIDIESIRILLKNTALKPSNKIIKIYIIHNAHNMRIEGFNAMLKTIEELKDYNMVIFTTKNKDLLLPTIRSRCQIIRLDAKDLESEIDTEKLSEIISEVYKGNINTFYTNKSFFESFKNDKYILFDGFIDVFNEVLKNKYTNENEKLNLNIKKLSEMDLGQIEEIINLLYTVKIGLKNNINYDLAIEELIFSIYKGGMTKWT